MATLFQELGWEQPEVEQPQGAFAPATLPETVPLPPPGIYFGMPEDVYHALPALSSHGVKKLAASPMVFWASTTWLSAKRRKAEAEKALEEKIHQTIGKAYHCRIMEGREEFHRRFAVELTAEECEGALETTDQIKAAIGQFKELAPVSSVGNGKDALVTQLALLMHRDRQPADEDIASLKVDDLKARIRCFKEEQPVKPVAKVADKLADGTEYERQAVKADWIEQLLALNPDAKILDVLNRAHRETHAGKSFISAEVFEQIEIAARMVEADPEIRHAFRDGHAEVTLIWHCAKTGVPMKCRVDYLKLKACVDLKTVVNQRERSIENAIRFEIAGYNYNVQPSVYIEGVEAVRKLVREQGEAAIHVADPEREAEIVAWTLKWAKQSECEWLWVFQQKGDAPVTRGVFYPLRGTTKMVTDDIVLKQKRRFRQFSETFGIDPWVDVKPIYDLADEDLPASATEI